MDGRSVAVGQPAVAGTAARTAGVGSGVHRPFRAQGRCAAHRLDPLLALLSAAFFGYDGFATLYIFLVEQVLFVGFFGYSIGHRLMRMQVQTLDGRPAGYLTALIRSVLLCLVVPALVLDADQRGLHDRVRNTGLFRI
ncbi:RDD family protein [Arthrobacter sp. MN05-02]|nr:RDD family protein [Arthrobacter sp. MN05-02]